MRVNNLKKNSIKFNTLNMLRNIIYYTYEILNYVYEYYKLIMNLQIRDIIRQIGNELRKLL